MPECFSHPGNPISTSFILIASGAGTYDIRINIFATKRARMYMVQSELR